MIENRCKVTHRGVKIKFKNDSLENKNIIGGCDWKWYLFAIEVKEKFVKWNRNSKSQRNSPLVKNPVEMLLVASKYFGHEFLNVRNWHVFWHGNPLSSKCDFLNLKWFLTLAVLKNIYWSLLFVISTLLLWILQSEKIWIVTVLKEISLTLQVRLTYRVTRIGCKIIAKNHDLNFAIFINSS